VVEKADRIEKESFEPRMHWPQPVPVVSNWVTQKDVTRSGQGPSTCP
jgi:hypothetical protein